MMEKNSPTTTHLTGPILFSHSENPVSSRTLQIKDVKRGNFFRVFSVKLWDNEEQLDFIRAFDWMSTFTIMENTRKK